MFKSLIYSSAVILSLVNWAHAENPLAFDVAEDHTRIFMANAPLHENGMPAHGNAFISQGYIYPAGTLKPDTTGVLPDGRPAFPDLVLGTWTCDGYFVGEGGNATTGIWIISRQTFVFGNGDTIVTQGTEIVDPGVENLRPVTGATGDYAHFSESMGQTLLGFSDQMTVNIAFRVVSERNEAANIRNRKVISQTDAAMQDRIENGHQIRIEDSHLEWDSGGPVGPVFEDQAVGIS